ncbi:hypothetical protein HPB50_017586 [Hyalomma asiaticum]|uniref:Uncharacterized protein n=1 Tax=Hyalomma asiaticum TaxID=266040 RepID=A0ACB7SP49_HYAAI|nr:hypothetical protein HPB50_017586 [Hyalomma asiaticum]
MYSEYLSDRIERVKAQCVNVSRCSTTCKCDEECVSNVAYLSPDISYREFFLQYASSNTPCILSPQHTSDWRSRLEWVDSSGRPKLEFLKSSFGSATVPVSDCSVKQYDSPSCCEITFSEYVDYWQKLIDSGHDYCANPCLYLKDWHFTRDFPTYVPYATPKYFTSDWLNEYWDLRTDVKDDFRFVYMGPKGSWTPLHTDVFKSFSWSANICGRKLWYLFPPREGQVNKGKKNKPPCDVNTLLEESVKDAAEAPNLPKQERNMPYLKVIQNPGEIIFVPSNWYHQVHNLDDTISINHNFLNACNVKTVMINLMAALIDVQEEIADFQDTDGFQEHCQPGPRLDVSDGAAPRRLQGPSRLPLTSTAPDLGALSSFWQVAVVCRCAGAVYFGAAMGLRAPSAGIASREVLAGKKGGRTTVPFDGVSWPLVAVPDYVYVCPCFFRFVYALPLGAFSLFGAVDRSSVAKSCSGRNFEISAGSAVVFLRS